MPGGKSHTPKVGIDRNAASHGLSALPSMGSATTQSLVVWILENILQKVPRWPEANHFRRK